MTKPIDTLNLQHQNIGRLIALIEREVDVVDDGGMPRVAMLQDIMQYINHFMGATQHSLEERLIARAEAVGTAGKADLDECRRLRDAAATCGRTFAALVEAVREEQLVERTGFVRAGRDFVEAQRRHFAVEEDKVFPALRRVMREDELEALGDELERERDPLLGGIVEKEYRQLYEYILRSSA